MERAGTWGAGGAHDQHSALGTCGLIQMLEFARKGLGIEAQALVWMRSGVYEVAHEVALCFLLSGSSPVLSGNLPGAPSELPAIVWAPLALFLWAGLCLLLRAGREPHKSC